ncbi:MAG TPA: SDR family oxidoreductase [Thermoleophilaceae bacterium]|nr:SDR family oxidoreductase [Thermoleophilaceae bacterium]
MAIPDPSKDSAALVTGASSGIGADIARSLARRGRNVVLVARREQRLSELADELVEAHGVRAETIAADLQTNAARKRLPTQVEDLGLRVDVLVNNAGFGTAGPFQRLDGEREAELVRLNCEVVVDLCGRFVPTMVERGGGGVLNVASTAAFQPLPTQATYSASKAFVLTFTQALGADLHGTGVTATALCPGPVKTEFIDVAGLAKEAAILPDFVWVSSPDVAEAGVDGLERGKGVVIPGLVNKATALGGHFTPRSVLLGLGRRVYRLGTG